MPSHARFALLLVLAALGLPGQTQQKLDALLGQAELPGVIRSAAGVTRQEVAIPSLLTGDDLDYRTPKTRILLIAGLDGDAEAVQALLEDLRWFYASPEAAPQRARFAISAVPVANPEGWAAGRAANSAGGDPTRGYPPQGEAYASPTDSEAAYLWRWIGMHAPDLVADLRGGRPGWKVPSIEGLRTVAPRLRPVPAPPEPESLAANLATGAPAGTGSIPTLELHGARRGFLSGLLADLEAAGFREPSPARREIQRRLDRTPLQVARQLAEHYGHELPTAVYIPAVALMGRLYLGELTQDPSHLADVERIVAPYLGDKPSLPEKPSPSHFSGHLLFGELALRTGNPAYTGLVRKAADYAFDPGGKPLDAMPFHNEMSDGVFMGGPILALAGRLTGEAKYHAMSVENMRFMARLNLRSDGLYQHSPLDPAAWGRGNGFPALGLALSLSWLPEDHPGRGEMMNRFRSHIETLLRYQDPTGAWHQVIDFPGSYRELTATSMIAFAMLRGVRMGWLDRAAYEPAIRKAWYAIRTRVAPDGELVDVCTSTGKQRSRRDYLDRTAILGKDPRGGAMALLIATEIARWDSPASGP